MNNNIKVLIVDDEQDIVDMISYNLEKEGYMVKRASNGKEAIAIAKVFYPEIILLDVMMPEMDGIETCQELRALDKIGNPVIAFLTARGEDYSQIAGFEAGADDYISKPVKPKVLISRIKALLRRGRNEDTDINKNNNETPIYIDREKYLAFHNGKELSLPKKEFELLALLVSKPKKVFTREVILHNVWGDEIIVGDRTIDVHIRKLREKLGNQYIKTVKGVGYKIEF